MEKKYKKGEVVWAKVRGFPWWPAVVKSVNSKIIKQDDDEEEYRQTLVLVYFVGDNSHSELPLNKIQKFASKYEEYSKTKKKCLLNSIKQANKIISNEISFEKHLTDLNKNEKRTKKRTNEKIESNNSEILDDKSSDDECEEKSSVRQNFLGMKRKMRKLFKKNEERPGPQIEFCVEDDFSKNIKINININVNNNMNNTLNINTLGKKIIDDESEVKKEDSFTEDNQSSLEESESSDENLRLSDELREVINSLLFYKINMPSATSNKSIICSLEDIQNKLQVIKNMDTYELIKDLIPILTSFLFSHNQIIVTKSSELFSIIKEKIIEDLFDVNNEFIGKCEENSEMHLNLKHPAVLAIEELKILLENDLKKLEKSNLNFVRENSSIKEQVGSSSRNQRRNSRKKSYLDISAEDMKESLSYINEFEIKSLEITKKNKNVLSSANSEKDTSEIIKDEIDKSTLMTDNLKTCNKTFSSESVTASNLTKQIKFSLPPKTFFNDKKIIAYNKKRISPLDPNQIRFLFKGFFGEDDDCFNFEELNGGLYSNKFYKNVYDKYNGLTESVATKRKYVCMKLLQILKLFLPRIDSEELKKTIVFFEYNIRTKDPTLGKIYKQNLESFYDRLKEILSLATESLNNFNKQKSKN